MAYEVTATRRRPQRFEDLIGQEFVAETFKNSIQAGRIAHAYLFSGPRGCGKTSTARILAKALNCEKGPTATPCGQCSACKEITAGSSLDVIEIDGASNTSVNDVRQIKDEVLFPPNTCRYKVYIIDEVHMLSTSAFNALLKTIEEPPPYVIFIFATTELQKVPATIKSRCQQFNFRLVPIEKVKEQLAQACADVNIKADDEALYWIARESTGSMRDAYTLFDQVAAFSGDEITYEKIRDKLGLLGVDRLNELFGLCIKRDNSNALIKLDEYLQNGVSIEQLISNCTDYLRSLLLIKSGVTKEALLGQSADRYSKDVLSTWNSVQIERALDIFMKLYRDIRYSISPRYEFELAVSRLCWLSEYVSATDVKKAIDAVKPLLQSGAGARQIVVQSENIQSAVTQKQQTEYSEQASNTTVQAEAVAQMQDAAEQVSTTQTSIPTFSGLNQTQDVPDYGDGAPEGEQSPEENATQGFNWTPPFREGGAEPPEYNSADVAESEPEKDQTDTVVIEPQANIDTSSITTAFDQLLKDFAADDGLLSAALSDTTNRKIENDCLTVTCSSTFNMMQIQSNTAKIEQYLSKAYKKKMRFAVIQEEIKSDTKETQQLPFQVEIIKDAFKGSLI